MVKVVAKVRGYHGGLIREPGEVFDIPEGHKLPKWVRNHAGAGKVEGEASGPKPAEKPVETSKPPVVDPAGAIVVPADWKGMKASDRKALAKSITGQNSPNVQEADRVIEAYVETTKPAPFEDAPSPETVTGSAVMDALGGVQPDWVAPVDNGEI